MVFDSFATFAAGVQACFFPAWGMRQIAHLPIQVVEKPAVIELSSNLYKRSNAGS
jgi:hypothetical protein